LIGSFRLLNALSTVTLTDHITSRLTATHYGHHAVPRS
jgi:hypothetical protein